LLAKEGAGVGEKIPELRSYSKQEGEGRFADIPPDYLPGFGENFILWKMRASILVVTSPPYPMVKMWDDLFTGLNPDIGICLNQGDYRKAFELMHQILDEVWVELYRVMKAGAIACINTATRRVQPRTGFNYLPTTRAFKASSWRSVLMFLPVILWRKQTNAPNKFMGSGMLPAGAYVTLEHEFILIFSQRQ